MLKLLINKSIKYTYFERLYHPTHIKPKKPDIMNHKIYSSLTGFRT